MEVDTVGAEGEHQGRSRARRTPSSRTKHWGVDTQPVTLRPAACRACGATFEAQELRMCAWTERTQSRWMHPQCVPSPATVEQITALGASTEQQVAAARAALRTEAPNNAAASTEQATENLFEDTARACWAEASLPNPEWWQRVSLTAALQKAQTTFVQIPDRILGGVLTARAKALEVLSAAWERGADENEWKAFLLFDALLLSHGGAGTTNAELLEERLAWWWGGQWETLWDSAFGRQALAPATRTTAQSDRQRATRVHTLAANGEEGRALSAVSSSKPAPRTPETLQKLKDLFPQAATQSATSNNRQPPTEQLREEVEEEVVRLLTRAPRLTSPGLLGTRLEHLVSCRDDPEALKLLSKAMARVAFGEVPDSVLAALR